MSKLISKLKADNPLLRAAKEGHVNTVEYLINYGAKIAISDSKGFNSLHYEIGKDNKELVQWLLTKGVDIEAKSVDGTPVHYAASSGSLETAKFLLGYGAEVGKHNLDHDSFVC